jgi:hypothetical protein
LISLTGSTSDEVHHHFSSPEEQDSDFEFKSLLAIDQLWPQLQELVEPFGLRLRDEQGNVVDAKGAEEVRKKADDLRDPDLV